MVYLYISDELDEPIQFSSGSKENELVINVDEHGIDYTWTTTSYWKQTKDFFKSATGLIVNELTSIWEDIQLVAGLAMRSIKGN